MPWNGAGVFTRLYNFVTDAAGSIKILATRQDAEWDNVVAGLNNVLARDGQNSPTADINWGGRKITNIAAGTAGSNDAARMADVVGGARSMVYCSGFSTASLSTGVSVNLGAAGTAPTVAFDTKGEFNVSTGLFTAAAAGKYFVSASWKPNQNAAVLADGSLRLVPAVGPVNSSEIYKLLNGGYTASRVSLINLAAGGALAIPVFAIFTGGPAQVGAWDLQIAQLA